MARCMLVRIERIQGGNAGEPASRDEAAVSAAQEVNYA